ncbi:MAG: hypothetical protein Q9219_000252 [cf. Caloplaca sp. 3 TL-2023]
MATFATRRLSKELAKIHSSLPPGISLVSADDFKQWEMDIRVLDPNPLYLDKTFRLRFRFSNNYPIGIFSIPIFSSNNNTKTKGRSANTSLSSHKTTESPEVTFTPLTAPPRPIPIHPHVYSNGYICLDLLGAQGWSPVQNVESVCMSIQSMLTGNSKNERPPGDEEFVRRNTLRPRDVNFVYEDASV